MEREEENRGAAAPAAPAEQVTRAARLRWPVLVVALLLTHAGALLLAVKIAQGDPSQHGNRIDPRYYERDARGVIPDRQAPATGDAAAREAAPR